MGVESQDGHDLARAQGDADIDHPDQPIGKRCLAQGKPFNIGADWMRTIESLVTQLMIGLRTRRFLDAKGLSEYAEDPGDGAKPDASH